MSAFIVDKSHIDALCYAAATYPRAGVTWKATDGQYKTLNNRFARTDTERPSLDDIGQMLWHENMVSVSHRYPNDVPGDMPGPIGLTVDVLLSYRYTPPIRTPTVIEALKLISCYDYQSCEHDDWTTSEASAFCEALKDALIDALPGYDHAPWTWDDPDPIPTVPVTPPAPPASVQPSLSRDDTIKRIKTALKRRSGKTWSVTRGRGTSWGWIKIDAPPLRRQYNWSGTLPQDDGYSSLKDRMLLQTLLGLTREIHPQGHDIPASADYYQEYVDRAEGRPPTITGTQYWD